MQAQALSSLASRYQGRALPFWQAEVHIPTIRVHLQPSRDESEKQVPEPLRTDARIEERLFLILALNLIRSSKEQSFDLLF
jgi:hypothetical protein